MRNSWRDTTRSVVRLRSRAKGRWKDLRREAHALDSLVARELPSYFVDRYAFREHPLVSDTERPPTLHVPPTADRAEYLAMLMKPAHRLAGWAPMPGAVTGTSALYDSLRQRWAAFCRRMALPDAVAAIPDARTRTWAQVMDDSVFYPGPPVFRGATFVDALTPAAADHLLARVGVEGAVDFYCFMLQVHETVHRYQAGEPLLNEVVQAAIWSAFLSEESLWDFQRDPSGSLVRESDLVERFPLLVSAATAATLDTSRLIASIAADNAYFSCCLLAHRFDRGDFGYAEYLSRLSDLLARRSDERAVRRFTLSML